MPFFKEWTRQTNETENSVWKGCVCVFQVHEGEKKIGKEREESGNCYISIENQLNIHQIVLKYLSTWGKKIKLYTHTTYRVSVYVVT